MLVGGCGVQSCHCGGKHQHGSIELVVSHWRCSGCHNADWMDLVHIHAPHANAQHRAAWVTMTHDYKYSQLCKLLWRQEPLHDDDEGYEVQAHGAQHRLQLAKHRLQARRVALCSARFFSQLVPPLGQHLPLCIPPGGCHLKHQVLWGRFRVGGGLIVVPGCGHGNTCQTGQQSVALYNWVQNDTKMKLCAAFWGRLAGLAIEKASLAPVRVSAPCWMPRGPSALQMPPVLAVSPC